LYKYVQVVPRVPTSHQSGATTGGLPLQELHKWFRLAIYLFVISLECT